MKKPGDILRIQKFSDSEEENEDVEMDEDQAENSEKEQQSESDEIPGTSGSKQKTVIKKKGKKGIIYISSIPQHMNVAICREYMEHFGEVGRIFLQPDSKGSKLSLQIIEPLTLIIQHFSDKESQQEEEECHIHRRLGGVRKKESRQMGRTAHQHHSNHIEERIKVLRYSLESQISSWLQMDSPQRKIDL